MSKKFTIAETINLTKLRDEIALYKCKYMTDPYVFMNFKTLQEVLKDIEISEKSYVDCLLNGHVGYFEGFKLFIDGTLGFGEVELR